MRRPGRRFKKLLTYMFKYVIMVLEGNAMEYMNATNARKNFFNLISDVNRDHVPVRISGPRGSAVLIGEEDWNSIQETLRLHSIPGLVESIHEASAAPESDFTPMEDMQWE